MKTSSLLALVFLSVMVQCGGQRVAAATVSGVTTSSADLLETRILAIVQPSL